MPKTEQYYEIPVGLAHLLQTGLSSDGLAQRATEWESMLASATLTEEMRQVFIAFGWLTPRDRRVVRSK